MNSEKLKEFGLSTAIETPAVLCEERSSASVAAGTSSDAMFFEIAPEAPSSHTRSA